MRTMFRSTIALIVISILIFLFGMAYWNSLQSSVSSDKSSKVFVIKKGESIDQIATRLKEEELIKSSWMFKYLVKSQGLDSKIQAGDFKLSPSMDLQNIIDSFLKGSIDKWVTLIEGWRLEEMARKLNEELGVNSDEFLKVAKEGHMFPDTYLFNPDAQAVDIASIMKNNFDKKYTQELQAKIRAKGLTPEQGVILASIVEREGRSDKVRTDVASILLKRLKIGMKLDADATVQYAKDTQILKKNGKLDKFWKPIYREDYKNVVSPYNTYLNSGLPPGPIANPSLSALNAVANANPNTSYLFYYHDSAGNSHLAKTLDEHNENVASNP